MTSFSVSMLCMPIMTWAIFPSIAWLHWVNNVNAHCTVFLPSLLYDLYLQLYLGFLLINSKLERVDLRWKDREGKVKEEQQKNV